MDGGVWVASSQMATQLSPTTPLANGAEMPLLGFGTYQLGDEAQTERAVATALEVGYRHIDTASFYENEAAVGRAIRSSGIPRDEIFLTTKLWTDDMRRGEDGVLDAFEQSLDRLKLNYVDLYLMHWPTPKFYVKSWRTLEQIYEDGRALSIGVSNCTTHHLEKLLDGGSVVPMVNQVECHPHFVQADLVDFCKDNEIVVTAWSPLNTGDLLKNVELKAIAAAHGKTVAQVILRWHLQHGVAAIPKSSTPKRIAENFDVFDFKLSLVQMDEIDALDTGERSGPDPEDFSF